MSSSEIRFWLISSYFDLLFLQLLHQLSQFPDPPYIPIVHDVLLSTGSKMVCVRVSVCVHVSVCEALEVSKNSVRIIQ